MELRVEVCEPRRLLGQILAEHVRSARLGNVTTCTGPEPLLASAPDGSPRVVLSAPGPARALLDAARPDLWLLVLEETASPEAAAMLLRRGARGVFPTSSPPRDLVRAIRALGAGERWLPPGTAYAVLEELAIGPKTPDRGGSALTARERQVVLHLAQGRTVIEIATALKLSPRTIQTHLRNAQRKLGVHSQVEAAALARAGLC